MDVSVVIRTKNEADFVDRTLRKLLDQNFRSKYEIIIVDSGSSDGTLDIIKKYDVRLIQIAQEEFSYGRSLNIGASHAKGKFVVNLSAHALPRDNNWLANLVKGFEDNEVAAVYGRQMSIGHVNPFEALLNELFFGEDRIKFNLRNGRMLKKIHFTNSNAAIRKAVWQEFRFDEQVVYGEDILWQAAVIRAGFSIEYAPDAAVYHTHRVSVSSVFRNAKHCAYNCSLADQKRQWISLIIYDVAVFLSLIPCSVLRNLRYIWQNDYYRHAMIAPFWVLSELLGSLMGRINYRTKRQS